MQIERVREPHILAAVGTTVLFLLLVVSAAGPTTAQTTTNATNTTIPTPTTTTAVTNFTKLFLQNKEFQTCLPRAQGQCFPTVDVLYQSPTTLVLKSRYVDTIWKAVDLAKKEGYKIDGISTYVTTSGDTGTVNALVAMSRG